MIGSWAFNVNSKKSEEPKEEPKNENPFSMCIMIIMRIESSKQPLALTDAMIDDLCYVINQQNQEFLQRAYFALLKNIIKIKDPELREWACAILFENIMQIENPESQTSVRRALYEKAIIKITDKEVRQRIYNILKSFFNPYTTNELLAMLRYCMVRYNRTAEIAEIAEIAENARYELIDNALPCLLENYLIWSHDISDKIPILEIKDLIANLQIPQIKRIFAYMPLINALLKDSSVSIITAKIFLCRVFADIDETYWAEQALQMLFDKKLNGINQLMALIFYYIVNFETERQVQLVRSLFLNPLKVAAILFLITEKFYDVNAFKRLIQNPSEVAPALFSTEKLYDANAINSLFEKFAKQIDPCSNETLTQQQYESLKVKLAKKVPAILGDKSDAELIVLFERTLKDQIHDTRFAARIPRDLVFESCARPANTLEQVVKTSKIILKPRNADINNYDSFGPIVSLNNIYEELSEREVAKKEGRLLLFHRSILQDDEAINLILKKEQVRVNKNDWPITGTDYDNYVGVILDSSDKATAIKKLCIGRKAMYLVVEPEICMNSPIIRQSSSSSASIAVTSPVGKPRSMSSKVTHLVLEPETCMNSPRVCSSASTAIISPEKPRKKSLLRRNILG